MPTCIRQLTPQGSQLNSSNLSGHLLSFCCLNYRANALKVSQSSTMAESMLLSGLKKWCALLTTVIFLLPFEEVCFRIWLDQDNRGGICSMSVVGV